MNQYTLDRNKLFAIFCTLALIFLGLAAFGKWTALVFFVGFFGGLLLWIRFPTQAQFAEIKAPFWLTLGCFVFHRIEENLLKFQDELSKLTGAPVPSIGSPALIALVLLSLGGWIATPLLMSRNLKIGTFLAWSFFSSMGLTELAHFIFPLFRHQPYGYFPGMASVLLLAPAAWWGMLRLGKR